MAWWGAQKTAGAGFLGGVMPAAEGEQVGEVERGAASLDRPDVVNLEAPCAASLVAEATTSVARSSLVADGAPRLRVAYPYRCAGCSSLPALLPFERGRATGAAAANEVAFGDGAGAPPAEAGQGHRG
jgi:hypothetical protein